MPVYHTVMDELMIGTDYSVRRIIRGIPDNLTLEEAWLTVKENVTKTDAQAIFQRHVNGTPSAEGEIIADGGSDGVADIIFYMIPANTILLTPFKNYLFDIQVELSDGRFYAADEGVVIATARVGRVTGV